MPESKKKSFNWFAYIVAWITYAGAFLTRVGNLGNVIKESFADIHLPQKDEFTK